MSSMMSYYTPSPAQPAQYAPQQGMFVQQPAGMMYVPQQQPGRVSPPMMYQQPQPMMMQQQPVHTSPPPPSHPADHHIQAAPAPQPGRVSPVNVPVAAGGISQAQLNAMALLRQKVNAEAALYPADVMAYCTDGCLSRYLRARDWDVEQAYKMLKGSLDWRASFKPHHITEAQIQGPLKIGTMFQAGFDKQNRPIIYVKPGAHSPNTIDERVMYVAWLMEHVTGLMGEGVEQVMIIMDFSEFGKRAKSPDSRQTAQAIINILQNHYPERLGAATVINSPWYFNLLFKMMSPFINANTKKKMNWITGDHQQIFQILCQSVEPDQLLTLYGGKNGNFPAGGASH